MGQLFKLSYLNESDRLAVAVCCGGRHVGILYRDEDNPERIVLFHLCWNKLLKNLPPQLHDECSFWVVPILEPEQINRVIAHAIDVWEKHADGNLPFGFNDPRGFFDSEGNMILGPNQVGLTCATITLAIFDLSGVPLIQYDTWEPRADDAEAQRSYVQTLRNKARTPEDFAHADRVEGQIGAIRFRPLEAASGALSEDRPIHFTKAERLAREIQGAVNESDRQGSILFGHAPKLRP